MAIDTSAQRSRRALLASVLGGAAAALAATVVGAQRVLAAGDDGEVLHVGDVYSDVGVQTILQNHSNNNGVLIGDNQNAGVGVTGRSATGRGVVGSSNGQFGAGVYGHNGAIKGTSIYADKVNQGIAVWGDIKASTSTSVAVFGRTKGTGTGVMGENTADGNGAAGVARGLGNGVYGGSTEGRGGWFTGKKANLRLEPSDENTHPASGEVGDLYVDKNRRLWFSKGGTTWVRLA